MCFWRACTTRFAVGFSGLVLLVLWLGRVSDISNVLCLEMLFRRRVHRRLVSDEIRHTPCVVDVGPRLTICKNRPVGNVVTLLSVRESVSSKLLTGFSLKKRVSFPSAVWLLFQSRNTVSFCILELCLNYWWLYYMLDNIQYYCIETDLNYS